MATKFGKEAREDKKVFTLQKKEYIKKNFFSFFLSLFEKTKYVFYFKDYVSIDVFFAAPV